LVCPGISQKPGMSWNFASFCPGKSRKVLENVLKCPGIWTI